MMSITRDHIINLQVKPILLHLKIIRMLLKQQKLICHFHIMGLILNMIKRLDYTTTLNMGILI